MTNDYSPSTSPVFKHTIKEKQSHKIPTKGKFSQEVRFKDAKLYCQGTGESVFTGPGSYDPI